jgi:hypothetical protein
MRAWRPRHATVLALLCALIAPLAAAEEFVTSQGQRIDLPPMEGLDCERMSAVLDAIDETGYRGAMPRPDNAADLPLMRYEHRLSARYYARCVRERVRGMRSEDAFTQGYRR